MLTTEPLNTANIVDIPVSLSTPFDYPLLLPDGHRHRRGQRRPLQCPSVGMVLQKLPQNQCFSTDETIVVVSVNRELRRKEPVL
jgi:hypothetical protein